MAANGVGLLTKIGQIIKLATRRGFNPLQVPQPVYWTDMNELINTVELLTKDVHNINNNLPPFWSASSTGTPNVWFTEVYTSVNEGTSLTTLYQDVLQAGAITSSGSSIDYHYKIGYLNDTGSAIVYVKAQQDPALGLDTAGMKVGDDIIGSSSGAVAKVISISGVNIILDIVSGTFTTNDTVTGTLSGVSASVLFVYPLKVWPLGTVTLSTENSFFISGKIFFTNISSQTAENEFYITYNSQPLPVIQESTVNGINTLLPLKLILQGQSSVSNRVAAYYGRGILYQLIPGLSL